MDAYTHIKKSDENLRNAIHKAYGKKCFYCGEKINMHQLEVDHIIPSSDKDMPHTSELQDYLKELEANKFIKDCIANYLPSCAHCNKEKSSRYFTVGNLRYFHEQTLRRTNKIIKLLDQFSYAHEDPQKEHEIKKLSEGKDYIQEKTIVESPFSCAYAYGLGTVRVNAFIPISIEDQLSCLIIFKQSGLSDCMFSFDENHIKFYFFEGYKTGVTSSRNFIWYIDNGNIAIKLPNTRFVSDFEIAEQLSIIFDDLYDEFDKRKSALLNTIGATYFEEVSKGKFSLLRVPKNIWIAMVDFAQQHDYFVGDTEWDIFRPLNLLKKNHIMICKKHLDNSESGISTELYVNDLSGNYVDIIWKAGWAPKLRKMEGFDNKIKWKADYTHDWILNEFIPYIFYLNTPDVRTVLQRVYKKRLSFEEYKFSFDYRKVGIQSLSISE
ncbi:HNH endonuclease [Paenibacillus mesophilus]|uniref:HNH endonuclease n=1 Tax=Paenibacillus mesophilus TaxID=2582849 RepID=UPI00110D9EAA|nr:HNH endonuclease signature motif containing protein [Paenibacillus mesophilus]TMV49570.1 HNH endonuclease [Paenibacillus mesophilus]